MNDKKTRRNLSRLLLGALLAVGSASVLAQFARLGWVPELASHFRLQYLVGLSVLAPALAMIRRPGLALAALALLAPNAWYTAPYVLPMMVQASAAAPPGSSVSVTSINLWYRNERYEDVRRYLEQTAPDVIVLSELTPIWVTELRRVTARYPYWMSVDRRSPWGLGVYSRYPLVNARATDLGVRGSVNIVATVEIPGGPVDLWAVHLSSPLTPERAAMRNAQLDRISDMVTSSQGSEETARPRLILGDLNVTPFSPVFRDFLSRTGMQDARRGLGLLGTWPTWMPLLQIQIDHCIADPALDVSRVARGPALGSDHYPLEITLGRRI